MEVTLSRRERERELRRQAMLDAARSVFAEKGYGRATLDEIAQRAEFGKGTLYNYFKGGKEAMLFDIFDQIYDDLVELGEAAFASTGDGHLNVRDRLHTYVLSSMRYFDERRDLYLILMKEAQRMLFSEDRERASYFKRQQQRVVESLLPHLRRAMEAGELRACPPVAVAHTLFGNINGLQMHLALHEQAECGDRLMSTDAAADFLTTLLMDGLLADPTAKISSSDSD